MRTKRSLRASVLQLLAITGFAIAPGLAAQDPSRGDAPLLSPGDSVRITVWQRPELTGEFVVGPDGSLAHPLYRAVRVGGVPLTTAEANLREFLTRFEDKPQFVMEPLLRVAVEGEVKKPDVYALPPQTTISQALARAGGFTEFARTDRVRLLRTDPSGKHTNTIVGLDHPETGAARMP